MNFYETLLNADIPLSYLMAISFLAFYPVATVMVWISNSLLQQALKKIGELLFRLGQKTSCRGVSEAITGEESTGNSIFMERLDVTGTSKRFPARRAIGGSHLDNYLLDFWIRFWLLILWLALG